MSVRDTRVYTTKNMNIQFICFYTKFALQRFIILSTWYKTVSLLNIVSESPIKQSELRLRAPDNIAVVVSGIRVSPTLCERTGTGDVFIYDGLVFRERTKRTNMCVMLLPHEISFNIFTTSANVRNHLTVLVVLDVLHLHFYLFQFIVLLVWTNSFSLYFNFFIIIFKEKVTEVSVCYTYLFLSISY